MISGNLQLLLSKDIAGNPPSRDAEFKLPLRASLEGQSLLRSYLRSQGVSRLEPRVVNVLASLIKGMDELLRRALGGEVEIETMVAGGLLKQP